MKKITIEIWSDVVCPFCYIGKRKLEFALKKFDQGGNVELIWKSFQLDPETKSDPGKTTFQYLADRYGRSVEWAKQAHENVTKMAADEGLEYRFDRAKVANTFDAHRVIQFAKKHNKADEMEELLFKSYFTDGKDISDKNTLVGLGEKIGLNKTELEKVLSGSDFGNAVRQDFIEAQQLGVTGVPFFVFNREYAISGAQPVEEFLRVLKHLAAEGN